MSFVLSVANKPLTLNVVAPIVEPHQRQQSNRLQRRCQTRPKVTVAAVKFYRTGLAIRRFLSNSVPPPIVKTFFNNGTFIFQNKLCGFNGRTFAAQLFYGHKTLIIRTFSITTLGMTIFSIVAFRITDFSISTLSITMKNRKTAKRQSA